MRTATTLRLGATNPARRLFCIPYAGGGAGAYRWWPKWLPGDIELQALQLPGRESRLRERPFESIEECVASALPVLAAGSDLPYAIFGHSMGALIAFELTLALQRHGVAPPEHLFVSGRRAPDEPDPEPPVHGLKDDEFLDELQRRYGAVPQAVREEPELLALLLPTLRADIGAIERYAMRPGARVTCPIHVYGGTLDRHPRPDQLPAWQGVAATPIRVREFEGDHFYLSSQAASLLADIAGAWPLVGLAAAR
jgi:surfactin synthase thioesterase subunit